MERITSGDGEHAENDNRKKVPAVACSTGCSIWLHLDTDNTVRDGTPPGTGTIVIITRQRRKNKMTGDKKLLKELLELLGELLNCPVNCSALSRVRFQSGNKLFALSGKNIGSNTENVLTYLSSYSIIFFVTGCKKRFYIGAQNHNENV